jgi:hypothetical protein
MKILITILLNLLFIAGIFIMIDNFAGALSTAIPVFLIFYFVFILYSFIAYVRNKKVKE